MHSEGTSASGASLQSLRNAGVPASHLKDEVDVYELKNSGGYTVADCLQAGDTCQILLSMKMFTWAEFRSAGVTVKQLLDAGCDLLALKQAGLRVGDYLDSGITVEVLLDTELFTATELCRAGVPVKQLLDVGCDLPTLKQAGFGVSDFLHAGVAAEVLLDTELSQGSSCT